MNKYKTFIFFVILTALWSCIFSSIKYFFWGDLQAGIAPDLQVISGYLSFGGIIAYLIGGAVAYTFLKKYLLFALSLLTFIFIGLSYVFPITQSLSLAFIMGGVGVFYGLWVVLRTIIASIEIEKTGMEDTKISAIISIVFIIFLIVGTILGSKLHESFGHNGALIILALLFVSGIISLFLDYDTITLKSLLKNGSKQYYLDKKHSFSEAINNFIPEAKYIFTHYKKIIILSSFIWSVSTVVSQKAVEYSVEAFNKLPSEAAILLLYSSVGAIGGNILSSFLSKKRWRNFKILCALLAICIGCLPFFSSSFLEISIIAACVGIAFGASTNLIDSFFLSEIGKADKKEYGAATMGLVFSIILFSMMFLSSYVDSTFGTRILMWVLTGMICVTLFINVKK